MKMEIHASQWRLCGGIGRTGSGPAGGDPGSPGAEAAGDGEAVAGGAIGGCSTMGAEDSCAGAEITSKPAEPPAFRMEGGRFRQSRAFVRAVCNRPRNKNSSQTGAT